MAKRVRARVNYLVLSNSARLFALAVSLIWQILTDAVIQFKLTDLILFLRYLKTLLFIGAYGTIPTH